MKKRFRIVLVILLVAGLGAFGWRIQRLSEPYYQGKSLRFWLEAYSDNLSATPDSHDPGRQQQAAAIVAIGTNALPILLSMLQVKDSLIKSNLVFRLRKQSFISTHAHTDREYRRMAVNGFDALGPFGEPAVPVLIRLLADPDLRCDVALSLGKIGPASQAAVPILIPWLTNTDAGIRYCAADALGRMGSAARAARPALLQHLNDTNEGVRVTVEQALYLQHAYPDILVPRLIKELEDDRATGLLLYFKVEALGGYGAQAKAAFPILLEILADQDKTTFASPRTEVQNRASLTDALKNIDPEAAARAGVK